jgi:hypothetical protein
MVTKASLDASHYSALECVATLQRLAFPLLGLGLLLAPVESAEEIDALKGEVVGTGPDGEAITAASLSGSLESLADEWAGQWSSGIQDAILLALPTEWGPFSVAGWNYSTAHEAAGNGLRSTAIALRKSLDWECLAPLPADDRRRVIVALTMGNALLDAPSLRAAIDDEWRRACQALAPAIDDSNWPTVSKAAQEQGVGKDVISKAANAGKLRTNGKVSHDRRIDPASLVEWNLSRVSGR